MTNNTYSLLSVLMTAYNRERFIAQAIESVLASTYSNFELIIVDDGSNDRTLEIARAYAIIDPRINVYMNEINIGDYCNRNRAASYAKGEFIMFVDSDDMILSDGFESCINAMKQFPEASFGMKLLGPKQPAYFLSAYQAIHQHFFGNPFLFIGPGGTIIRRKFFESIGGYPIIYGPANDMYFNLKATAAGGILLLPFAFNFYRIHGGQEINNKYSYLYNNYNYLRDALMELDLPLKQKEKDWLMNKNRRRFLVNIFRYFLQSGNLRTTAAACRLAQFGLSDTRKALLHPSL